MIHWPFFPRENEEKSKIKFCSLFSRFFFFTLQFTSPLFPNVLLMMNCKWLFEFIRTGRQSVKWYLFVPSLGEWLKLIWRIFFSFFRRAPEEHYNHPCDICGKKFTRPQHVARHKMLHTGERPFKCPKCPRQFTREDKLRHQ